MPEDRDASNRNHPNAKDPLWDEFDGAADRRSDWTDQELLDDVMFNISSDDFGLWELAGADAAEVEWVRRVRRLVHELVQRGWADVWERSVAYVPKNEAKYGPRVRLDQSRARDVLANEAHWDHVRTQGAPVRYFVNATDDGEREWRDDGRRRGLFRSA